MFEDMDTTALARFTLFV